MSAANTNPYQRCVPFLYLGALVISAIGVLGALETRQRPYSGFFITPGNQVLMVQEGSPAERADLRVDDQLLTSGGISVDDLESLRARPNPKVGDRRVYRVDRGGEVLDLELTFSPPPAVQQALGWVSLVVGLVFLGAGLWAYRRRASGASWLLAMLGLTAAGLFVTAPTLASPGLRRILFLVPQLLGIFAPAVFLHLMLAFPQPKAVLAKRWTRIAIYGLCLVAVALALGASFQGGAVIGTAGVFMFATRALFLILGLVALAHSWVAAGATERRASGLQWLLVAVAVALLPNIANTIAAIASPGAQLPGGAFYFLATALIPVVLAWAVAKGAGGGGEVVA